MPRAVTCDYCGQPAQLVTGRAIYPNRPDLAGRRFWQCVPCGAHVGCHANSRDHAPLGRLANADLRRAKQAAHASFDPIWKQGDMKRNAAYAWLADRLEIQVNRCHIGMMDEGMCYRVVAVCSEAN